MKQENHQITNTEGRYLTFYGYQSDKNTYDIVVDKSNGEISYLTNGLESDMNNMHGVLINKMKIDGIILTVLVNNVVKQVKTLNCTVKCALNRIRKHNTSVQLLNAKML